MDKTISILALLMFGCLLTLTSCKKDKIDKTLTELYKTYENGEISECRYNGNTVYSAGLNAYDAGSSVYNKDGNQIGSCNYAWGNPDPICGELKNCEAIYRIEDNIWGQPAVDKYELEN